MYGLKKSNRARSEGGDQGRYVRRLPQGEVPYSPGAETEALADAGESATPPEPEGAGP